MDSLAKSLYLLVARDFAPAEQRIPNLRQRMEGIPRAIAQAKANLQDPPRVHTETAIEQTQGAINLVREGLAPLLDRAPQMKKELAPLQEKTSAALGDYKNLASKRSVATLRRQFSTRRREVSKEAAIRTRFGPVDGRDHEARAGRPAKDANSYLRNWAAPLQKIFSQCR
jgi:hypothetical protein